MLAARPGTRTVTVSKNASCTTGTPPAPNPAARIDASRCTRSAIRRRPSGPCHTAYIPAMLASSTWAVQMFVVARSRRMCCSRVCRARRSAGRPWVSELDAHQAPGQRPHHRLAGGEEGGVGATEPHRHAEALRRADDDVGAPAARRLEQHEGQQVRRHDHEAAGVVDRREPAPASRAAGPTNPDGRRGRRSTRPATARRRAARPRPRCRPARPESAAPRPSAGGCRRRPRRPSRGALARRWAIAIASAAAVASSSIDALARSIPVRSATIVWKLRSASSRPWLISGW